MVEAKVLTKGQSMRLLKEMGDQTKKFEIPGYQILERIGKGSMGIVFKARQTSVDRIVAVKILLDALAQNKEARSALHPRGRRSPAKPAAQPGHRRQDMAAGESARPSFVMEYVEGSTIKDALDQNKAYDEKVALKIVMAVAEALKHAHQRGLIHRDIKPGNVISLKDGNAYSPTSASRASPPTRNGRVVRGRNGDQALLIISAPSRFAARWTWTSAPIFTASGRRSTTW